MNEKEQLELIKRYIYQCDDYMRAQYIQACNNLLLNTKADEADVLRLFKAKVRAEAFREFSSDLYKILYYRGDKNEGSG